MAKLDIKDAQIEPTRGKAQGTLTIAQHFALDPGWLNPLEHSYVITQVQYDYFVHDVLIKPMPQGEATYSLAEHAEMTADYKQAAFRLRPGLRFQDGTPLTTADVKWTYENFKGANAKIFHDKLDRIEIVDEFGPSLGRRSATVSAKAGSGSADELNDVPLLQPAHPVEGSPPAA